MFLDQQEPQLVLNPAFQLHKIMKGELHNAQLSLAPWHSKDRGTLSAGKVLTCRDSRCASSCCLQIETGFCGIFLCLPIVSLNIILCSDLPTRLTWDSVPRTSHLNLRRASRLAPTADFRSTLRGAI